ncbi:MAG TPA: NAD(P)/FAD-dependent oxidoreductase, partial [Thermoanaerobaculia bacterium]
VRRARLLAVRLPDVIRQRSGRGWEPVHDYWASAERITSRLPNRGRDRTVAEYLAANPRMPRRDRELLLSLVEGYDAAPADRVGVHSISTKGAEPQCHDQLRLLSGYDSVAARLASEWKVGNVSVRLGAAAREVRWRRGSVEVEASGVNGTERCSGRAVLFTLPIGVWKAAPGTDGAIRLAPEIRSKRDALAKMEMGAVVKVVLRFREPFWRDARNAPRGGAPRGETPRFGFLQARGADFPTWWSAEPVDAPVLTAWAGGPAAEALAGLSEAEVAGRAVATIAGLLGESRRRVSGLLEAWRMHDWQQDPFARGAYAYLAPGGVEARAAFARPVAGTLFFAGEATDAEEPGTVAGAIASGRRAARELLRARGTKRHSS